MSTHKKIASKLFLRLLIIVTVMTSLVAIPAWADKDGTTKLSKEVIEHLNFMREEEKLARDVYLFMNDTWKSKVFDEIAESEQQHMDTMLKMLENYDLPDPAEDEFGNINDFGVFNNEDLQEKYDYLIEIGQEDYIVALHEVGGFIEELDMIDIQEAIDVKRTPVALKTAYEHLMEGSKNHLRAFVAALEKEGFIYDEAQLLDQELFDAILDIP